jgi:hypothetical protein
MKETILSRITEELPELEPTLILVILIIILIWAILWFFVPFCVIGIWRRMRNIDRLIRQQVGRRHPDYSHLRPTKKPSTKAGKKHGPKEEIDEETKKILEEMGYEKKAPEDKRV